MSYKKGRRKEYKIVKEMEKQGYDIVQRTAGSHSDVDIFAIDKEKKIIKLIQSKRKLAKTMDYIDPNVKKKLEKENKDLNGKFKVEFEAR